MSHYKGEVMSVAYKLRENPRIDSKIIGSDKTTPHPCGNITILSFSLKRGKKVKGDVNTEGV
jgi:hypothetical protein